MSIFLGHGRGVRWKSTDIPEEHRVSIFRIEEQAKKATRMTQVVSKAGVFCG
jgi:hypothetical protein